MIPEYILEGMEEGTAVVYGLELGTPRFPGRNVEFYAGRFSRLNEDGHNVVIMPTDSRITDSLTSLDKHTDFLFKLGRDTFLEKPWVNELRTLLKSDLKSEDLGNVGIINAVEGALEQFLEISKHRAKFYSKCDSSERV